MIRNLRSCSLLAILFIPVGAWAQALETTAPVALQMGKHAPVRVPLQWPRDWPTASAVYFVTADDFVGVGQLVEPSFTTEQVPAGSGMIRKDLVFIAPKLSANQSTTIRAVHPRKEVQIKGGQFAWKEKPNDWAEVVFVDGKSTRPVMRYMHRTYDTSSKDARNQTYKVFHHLYDPAGTRFVTNGGHTDEGFVEKNLKFPHHRGLMFAFNKISYDKKTADTWHCTGDAHMSHQKTLFQTAGPVLAEHRVLLSWHGPKDEVFAEEERQMTVYNVPGGTLVEFASRLRPKVEKVRLDGDPQHAGFQFRAANDVAAKTAKETYYLRPDGKGKPGETRNWPGQKNNVNLPWNVLSFVLDGKRYSTQYIDHPSNPGEKRYSERDYGRFGCYFEYDLTPDRPLVLNHRVWLQEGEMTADQAESLRAAFVDAPRVATK